MDYKDNSIEQNKKNIFTKIINYFSNYKNNFKLFIILGVLALILGAWNMTSYIKNAFVESSFVLKDKATLSQNLNRLKDTDSDGISDYDELNTYGTSPYLEDTDSDGISDYDEIIAGDNPICAGEACNINIGEKLNEGEDVNAIIEDMSDLNLEEFKIFLIESGYPTEMVESLSLEDIEILMQTTDDSVINLSEDDLRTEAESLSVAEIRELLIQSGANVEQINSISDEELKAIYLEALIEVE